MRTNSTLFKLVLLAQFLGSAGFLYVGFLVHLPILFLNLASIITGVFLLLIALDNTDKLNGYGKYNPANKKRNKQPQDNDNEM